MKFAQNLQKLRKASGMSQEALAEKLDVTRQSVSKWESASSYPEMDKLIAICKIFEVDMETLLNGDVLEEKEETTKEQEQVISKELFNKFDIFMKKIVYLFDSMSAKELMSFIITILILFIIIAIMKLPFEIVQDFIGEHIFLQLGDKLGPILSNTWNIIIELIYVFFSIIFFIYFIKTKYIDHIKIETKKENDKKIIKEETNTKEKRKEEKVIQVVKKDNHSISDTFTQLIICFMKFIAICFLFGVGMVLLMFTFGLGLSISFLVKGLPVIGITIGLLGALLIIGVIFEIPLNFVINHKNSHRKIGVSLLSAFILLIIGTTCFMLDILKFTYIDDVPKGAKLKNETYEYQMIDYLNTAGIYYDNVNFVIDNTIDDSKIIIETSYYDYLIDTTLSIYDYNGVLHIARKNKQSRINISNFLDTIGKDLKEYTFYNYEKIAQIKTTIKATEKNIEQIKINNRHYEIGWDY